MRFGTRTLTRIRLRYEGAVLRVYRMDTSGQSVGYWTSRDARPGATAWRGARWLVAARPPSTYHAAVPEDLVPRAQPPPRGSGSPGAGVREPRRPAGPTLSGAAEVPLPGAD